MVLLGRLAGADDQVMAILDERDRDDRSQPAKLAERVGAAAFGGGSQLSKLVRAYVVVNGVAIALAIMLAGPGGSRAQSAAEAVWSWCRIG